MYGHNNADFAAGIVMQEIKDWGFLENGHKLPVMEHSQLRSLRVDVPGKMTVFVSKAHVGNANVTMTLGHLVNMWAVYNPYYYDLETHYVQVP